MPRSSQRSLGRLVGVWQWCKLWPPSRAATRAALDRLQNERAARERALVALATEEADLRRLVEQQLATVEGAALLLSV